MVVINISIKHFFVLKVHRRLLNDDALGVGEALNEYEFNQPVVARGQHILTFGKTGSYLPLNT